MKHCGGCNRDLEVSNFYKSSIHRDGLQTQCKECMKRHAKKDTAKQAKKVYMDDFNKKYNVEHPEIKYNAQMRRACELHGVEYVEDIDRVAVYGRDEGHCRNCRSFLQLSEAEVDHVIPLSKGGVHAYYNVQTLCRGCNAAKGDKIGALCLI